MTNDDRVLQALAKIETTLTAILGEIEELRRELAERELLRD